MNSMKKKKSIRVLLLGYLGANNLGDECMLFEVLNYLRKYDAQVTVASYGIDYKEINTIFPYKQRFKRFGRFKGKFEIYKYVKQVDMIIWVGGNCFTDHDGIGGYNWLLIAKLLDKKFIYLGIGIDKLKMPGRIKKTNFALNICDAIIFRDKYSLEYGNENIKYKKAYKNYIARDMGELYLESFTQEHYPDRDGILFSWRELQNHMSDQEVFIAKLARKLIDISEKFHQTISLFETDDKVDINVHYMVVEQFKVNGFTNYKHHLNQNLTQKINLIKQSKYVVTARLHTAVCAYLFGIPACVYNYSQKISELNKHYPGIHLLDQNLGNLDTVFSNDEVEKNVIDLPGRQVYQDLLSHFLA